MRLEKFIGLLTEHPYKIQVLNRKDFVDSIMEKLKSLTEEINFNCKFGKDGICKRYIGERPVVDIKIKMCCCAGCRDRIGFRKIIYLEDISFLAKNFDEKTGYWREGKGCILPREKRSVTCVGYSCIKDWKNLSERHNALLTFLGKRDTLSNISNILSEINDCHRDIAIAAEKAISIFILINSKKEKEE